MLTLGFILLITIIAASYALFLRRAEVRRQEWRRESRAMFKR
jgi:hypothetical protein